MKELLFMKLFFKRVIWGGSRMRSAYGYEIPGDDTGEAWAVSANPGGNSTVSGGSFDGWSLGRLWKEHRELFGKAQGEEFPLLVKVIDANDNLSIQVHPDDAYAFAHENGSKGKTECWYVLDCEEGADIIIGHRAQTGEELRNMIGNGSWDELLQCRSIHKGDFFYIPSGTVHAIRRGTLILEIQQNSDVTYRLYDYGRLQNGKPRELHLEKSMDVIRCPHEEMQTVGEWESRNGCRMRPLVSGKYFTAVQWRIEEELLLPQEYDFLIADVISGSGTADGRAVKAGDHFLVPYGYGNVKLEGTMEIITSHI